MMHHDKQNYELLSVLFAYPADPWLDITQLRQLIGKDEHLSIRNHVNGFLDYVEHQPLDELAKQYVATFDFSENSNLDLTSLLCSEDRKRGLVLANLKSIYHQAGLDVDSGELPDYLPMILEFLSVADVESSKEVLAIVRPGMEKLWEQLKTMNSPYAGVVEACLVSTASMTCESMATEGGVS